VTCEAAAERGGEGGHPVGQRGEVSRRQRLRAVGPGASRIRVHLDQQPVRARGQGGQGQRRHQRARPGRMRRVHDHRRRHRRARDRHRGDVEGVARGRLEGADAALAQHHARGAGREDVLGREQPLFDGGARRALQQQRASRPPGGVEQTVALAVAGSDLEEIDERRGGIQRRLVEDFDDDGQPDVVGGGAEHAQGIETAAPEAVGGRPRLPAPAAEQAGASRPCRPGCCHHELLVLDGTRAGGEKELRSTDRQGCGICQAHMV
jgi:hypothetical protein